MKLVDSELSRRLDRNTIENRCVPSTLLMENAARALAEAAMERLTTDNMRAAVFCGCGNNGGDGICAARIMLSRGYTVRVFLMGSEAKLTEDSREMLRRLREYGGDAEVYSGGEQLEFALSSGVIIDALIGTGLNKPVREDMAEIIRAINAGSVTVVSADIPSGVSADTGEVLGSAVMADETVTFGFPKTGLFVEPGCVYSGEVHVADIGIFSDEAILGESKKYLFGMDEARAALPKRPQLSHKGTFGKLLILGGSVGFTGAPYLAASAAVRSGSGLVYLGVPSEIYEIEAVKCSSAMPFPLPSEDGKIDGGSSAALETIGKRLSSCTACLVGPGLGTGEKQRQLMHYILENSRIPLIIDADGINNISGNIDLLDRAECPVILTPHEAEFKRLGGDISVGRVSAARDFAVRHSCTVVLKGHRSVTALPDGRCFVNTAGNSGMAKGGSGDVLAGIIAALVMQEDLASAVPLGVFLHGLAGDIAAAKYGEYSMTPDDIITSLPEAFLQGS